MSVEERLELMIKVGRRFNKIAVPALIILIVTGMYQAHLVLQKSDILYDTSYGNVLVIKMILVAALIGTYAIHVRIIRKDVEDQIRARKAEVEQLIKEMREANMESLAISPPEESKQFLDGKQKSKMKLL